MGAFFAVQVRGGLETRTKKMLEHVIVNANEPLVKGIYANETHTKFINKDKDGLNTGGTVIEESDIATHLKKEEIRASINNVRLELEAMDRYNTDEYKAKKSEYNKVIRELEKEFESLKSNSKTIHSVLQGYILIELKWNSEYLPNHIWQLIKSVPLVQKILSTTPIPEEEMNHFFSNLTEMTAPNVEIDFGKIISAEKIDHLIKETIYEVNKEETTPVEQKGLLERLDNATMDIVNKVKEIAQNKPVNELALKVKAFIKRKKRMVSMPLHHFEKLYTKQELEHIGEIMNVKDFLYRLANYNKAVLQ